jgi:hypothetical protein
VVLMCGCVSEGVSQVGGEERHTIVLYVLQKKLVCDMVNFSLRRLCYSAALV